MDFNDLKRKAVETGCNFAIVFPSDRNYNKKRKIANSRFNLRPGAIAYCEEAAHVACCIEFCRDSGTALRVRSGGHQHEGMCSGDDVLIIDLSKMNTIKYDGETCEKAWILPGKQLKDVYGELEKKNRIIPGGGCSSVCMGGLTQGGGWGLSARKLGLTCDNLLEAEVVLANGTIVNANDKDNSDLFWAIRGGGGGNFGVATKFLFKLHPLNGFVTTFELHWSNRHMLAITKKLMQELGGFDDGLTTFLRLSVVKKKTPDTVLLGGQFYGNKKDLLEALKPLYDVAHPAYEKYKTHEFHEKPQKGQLPTSDVNKHFLLANIQLDLSRLLQPAGPKAPKDTCDAPYPHKVSSTFPKDNDYEDLAEAIVKYIKSSNASDSVNIFLSLHSMGGDIKNVPDGGPFPYRDKEFMLQFQAWWSEPSDPDTRKYIGWIENFRKKLNPYIEGSFINFPDKDLVPNPDAPDGRIKLLEYFYGKNLHRLRKIKSKYDPKNLFSFGMSIPLLK